MIGYDDTLCRDRHTQIHDVLSVSVIIYISDLFSGDYEIQV